MFGFGQIYPDKITFVEINLTKSFENKQNKILKSEAMKNLFIFAIIFFSVAFLTSCGKDDPDTPGPEIKLPEINVDTPIVETQDGVQTVTLNWETKNLVSLTLQGELVSLSGSAKIPISSDTQFTFVGENKEGKTSSKTVPVVMKKIPTLILTATPAVVPPEGASVHITWVETNANLGVWLNNLPYFNGQTGVTIFVPARGLDTLTFTAKGSGGETTVKLYIPVEIPDERLLVLKNDYWYLNEYYETCQSKGFYHRLRILADCEKDDFYSFLNNGDYEYNCGFIFCGNEAQINLGQYTLIGDTLYGLGNPCFIRALTQDLLDLEFLGTTTINDTVVPMTIEKVFVHNHK